MGAHVRSVIVAFTIFATGCGGASPMTPASYIFATADLRVDYAICANGVDPATAKASREFLDFQSTVPGQYWNPAIAAIKAAIIAKTARFDGWAARQCIDQLSLDAGSCWSDPHRWASPLVRLSPNVLDQLAIIPELEGYPRGWPLANQSWLYGVPTPCLMVLTGLQQDGAACSYAFECQSGDCHHASSGCAGTCRTAVGLGSYCYPGPTVDEPFNPNAPVCKLDFYCSISAGNRCVTLPAQGTSCITNDCDPQCQNGLACPPALIGAKCPGTTYVNGRAAGCFEGLVCDQASHRCQAAPGPGQSCQCDGAAVGDGGGNQICHGPACDMLTAWCDGHLCHAKGDAGAACNLDWECKFGTECNNHVCESDTPHLICGAPGG